MTLRDWSMILGLLVLPGGGVTCGGSDYRLAEYLGVTWTDGLIASPAKAHTEFRVATADSAPVVFQTTEIVRYREKKRQVRTRLGSTQKLRRIWLPTFSLSPG